MAEPPIIDRDLGYQRIMEELAKMERMEILVGLQNDGAASPDGVLVAHYGAVNEFGTRNGHVPERSFMRSTFDESIDKLNRMRARIVEGVYAGKMDADRGAGLLGLQHQQDIQAKIGSNVPPPNAPSTVRGKGSSRTLIDSGTMRQSIRWVVEDKPGGFTRFVSWLRGKRRNVVRG